MRSRYCAYVKGDISYLTQTLLPEQRATFSTKAAKDWSERVEWLGLEILRSKGGESDQKGEVEFVARYRENGEIQEHHEFSTFKKLAGRWYFADGKVQNAIPDAAVISRNALCPCGSGKKYKRCCADKAGKK